MQRAAAALEHWNLTREVEPGLQALLNDASSPDGQRRRAAAMTLPRAKEIPGKVIEWVRSAKSGWAMLVTLGAIGPQAKTALPDVMAALAESDASIRRTAAWALYRITGAVDESVRLLMAQLITAPVGARAGIADALLEIGKDQPGRFRELLAKLKGDPKYAKAATELLALLPG